MCDALHYLLDNIFIRFGSKLYIQIVGIPMGVNCAPLVADLFLFCYERDFMLSLSDNNQTDIIEVFNSTSRYLDDLLNIDNPYFEQMVGQIYPTDIQLNKANSSDTEAPFLDLNLSITNGIVSSKRGSSTLCGIYIGFCPRTEFYKILKKDCLLHVCSICEIFTHSSISVVKFK